MHTKNNPLNCLSPSEWNAFINSIIKKKLPHLSSYYNTIDLDDLRQEAWIGLLAAAERFDSTKSRFTTYAYYYICGHVLRTISKKSKDADRVFLVSEDTLVNIDENNCYYDTDAERKDLRNTIISSIADQPHKYLLIERFVKEKSLRTIAKEQNVSHEIISSRIKKLLSILEKRMDHENA